MRYPDGSLHGGAPPTVAEERARLVAEVVRYLREWEHVLARGFQPPPAQLLELQQRAQALEARARMVGFGGIGHHLGECQRSVHAGADASVLRAQLATISELSWQARQELSAEERALMDRFAAGGGEPVPAAPPAALGGGHGALAPPRMVTVMGKPALGAAPAAQSGPPAAGAPPPLFGPSVLAQAPPGLAQVPSAGPAPLPPLGPAGPGSSIPAPGLPAASPPPGVAPIGLGGPAPPPPLFGPPPSPAAQPAPVFAPSAPPGPPGLAGGPSLLSGPPVPSAPPLPAGLPQAAPPNASGAPQFLVRTMFRLRGIGGGAKPPAPAPAQQGGSPSLLGLRSMSRGEGGPAPPPMVHDASGLPPLGDLGLPNAARAPSPGTEEMQRIFSRMGRERSTPGRERQSARPKPRRTPASRQRAAGGHGWLFGLAGVVGLGVLGMVAFLTLGGRSESAVPQTVTPSGSGQPSSSGSSEAAALPDAPREKLLAEDERFKALLSQVHGRGGKMSPELRALVNDQAALASKALTMKCAEGSGECATWQATRQLLVGERPPHAIKKRTPRPADQRASRWLAGLKLPNIPVEDDPRVQKVFEYYSESQVGRETFQSMLFRCGAYRDLILSTLIRYELPPDLLALVFTESGCEPMAKSPVGAAGLWQFMPDTARAYRLVVKEGVIDERHSPTKSTEAGVRFLADLRQKLGSWDLVFASYNMGPFGLLARIERAGGDVGFWDLVDADLLPDETSNYAPTVQAFALILANLQRLRFAGIQMRAPQLTADLEVPGGTSLTQVARAAATSASFIRTLNLDIVGHEVPNIPGRRFIVQVPKDTVWQARDTLQELIKTGDRSDLCVPPNFDWGKQRFTKEMAGACRKSLGSARADAPPATP